MTFNITPDEDAQAFEVTVTRRPTGATTTRHATTADVLEWLRKLVVESGCSLSVATNINPLDHPEPRYILEETPVIERGGMRAIPGGEPYDREEPTGGYILPEDEEDDPTDEEIAASNQPVDMAEASRELDSLPRATRSYSTWNGL